MKTRVEIALILLAAIGVAAAQHWFLGGYAVSKDLINNLIVFISITFGFFATSLAIFASSRYSGKLYDIPDRVNGGTLLHTLIKKYKTGLFWSLLSVVYLIIIEIHIEDGQAVPLSDWFASFLLASVVVNVFFAYRLIQIVAQFVLQEAKQ